jgi:hypothetical protein
MEFGHNGAGSASNRSMSCDFTLASAPTGGFALSLESSTTVKTRRVFMIGDGLRQPYQVLVLDGSEQVMLLDAPPPEPRALSLSPNHWYDAIRPDQGLALYEAGGTGIVFGTWFTVDEYNSPTWFYFEGVAAQGVGRRDVAIHRGSRADGTQHLRPVASGRLQYLDCNEAELRVHFTDGSLRTMRVRRGRTVAMCPIFQ